MRNRNLFKVATYNIHACVGTDGRRDPQRIADVIQSLNADIVGLQEVGSHPTEQREFKFSLLELSSGYQSVAAHTIIQGERTYGNALLTRHPVYRTEQIDLSVEGFEPRAAMDIVVSLKGAKVRIINTHLGLKLNERRAQIRRLVSLIAGVQEPVVLMGDFNEWWPWSRNLRSLKRLLNTAPSISSFPSRFPFLALDRIWVNQSAHLRRIESCTSRIAKRASDHLPVSAIVELAE